jgi:hypothetical protein
MRLFISYRHDDTEGYIGALGLVVQEQFGGDVELFVDVVRTGAGHDYVVAMLNAAESCDAAVACIGPKWRGAGHQGARIFEDDDPVRVELRKALSQGIPVYVGLFSHVAQPQANPSQLPKDLFKLAGSLAFTLSDTDFERDVVHMISHIRSEVPVPDRVRADTATLRISAPPGKYWLMVHLFLDRRDLGGFSLNKPALYQITPGPHTVQVRLGSNRSNALSIIAEAGQALDISFMPGGFARKMTLALLGG